ASAQPTAVSQTRLDPPARPPAPARYVERDPGRRAVDRGGAGRLDAAPWMQCPARIVLRIPLRRILGIIPGGRPRVGRDAVDGHVYSGQLPLIQPGGGEPDEHSDPF